MLLRRTGDPLLSVPLHASRMSFTTVWSRMRLSAGQLMPACDLCRTYSIHTPSLSPHLWVIERILLSRLWPVPDRHEVTPLPHVHDQEAQLLQACRVAQRMLLTARAAKCIMQPRRPPLKERVFAGLRLQAAGLHRIHIH